MHGPATHLGRRSGHAVSSPSRSVYGRAAHLPPPSVYSPVTYHTKRFVHGPAGSFSARSARPRCALPSPIGARHHGEHIVRSVDGPTAHVLPCSVYGATAQLSPFLLHGPAGARPRPFRVRSCRAPPLLFRARPCHAFASPFHERPRRERLCPVRAHLRRAFPGPFRAWPRHELALPFRVWPRSVLGPRSG